MPMINVSDDTFDQLTSEPGLTAEQTILVRQQRADDLRDEVMMMRVYLERIATDLGCSVLRGPYMEDMPTPALVATMRQRIAACMAESELLKREARVRAEHARPDMVMSLKTAWSFIGGV